MTSFQTSLDFSWESPVFFKHAFLVPKRHISGWHSNGNEGFVHGLNRNLTYKGGRIAVFRLSALGKTGYRVFNGWDELNKSFDIKYF